MLVFVDDSTTVAVLAANFKGGGAQCVHVCLCVFVLYTF